ncbi:Uncharacterised protein [Vibrio furnissii]|nr:hypothetical protein DN38_3091 [Vibrio cholerae]BCK15346.1 hypothetical protein VCSRO45_2966 [Vibrio cholerae]SUQ33746.1 Uncharacterised protein [Vibrio furnissii]
MIINEIQDLFPCDYLILIFYKHHIFIFLYNLDHK